MRDERSDDRIDMIYAIYVCDFGKILNSPVGLLDNR